MIKIKAIVPKKVTFWIRGTSPLIQHAWSQKALEMMRMTAQERKKREKVARSPVEEAENCCHKTQNGQYAIPLTAFKACLINAAHKDFGLEKTLLRKSFFIPSSDPNRCVPIESDDPIVREDLVRVGAGAADIRYRMEFRNWRAKITAEIDSELLTLKDIANLVNRAGFSVGMLEMRPEKGGEYGRFELDTSEPMEESE